MLGEFVWHHRECVEGMEHGGTGPEWMMLVCGGPEMWPPCCGVVCTDCRPDNCFRRANISMAHLCRAHLGSPGAGPECADLRVPDVGDGGTCLNLLTYMSEHTATDGH